MRAHLGPITFYPVAGWVDVTDDVQPAPYTLARQSPLAVGALQFSVAKYEAGVRPDADASQLMAMLREFAAGRSLGDPTEMVVESEPLRLAAATFNSETWVTRVWYVSDGASFVKLTYTAERLREFSEELEHCEQMIRTIAVVYGE